MLHRDHHAMWIDPRNPNHIIDGNDGGVGISYDRGETWDGVYNMDLGQFYHVSFDMETPYHVCGGLQDNYIVVRPERRAQPHGHWQRRLAATSRAATASWRSSTRPTRARVYTESQDGNIIRVDRVSRSASRSGRCRPRGEPPLPLELGHAHPAVRRTHPTRIYVGANKVFRSTDRGDTLDGDQPRPHREHRSREPVADGRGGQGHDDRQERRRAVVRQPRVSSPSRPGSAGVLYAGADDGTVHVTRDDGKTWTNITSKFPGAPKNAYVSQLVASAHEVNVVYATFDNHRNNDFNAYVYASIDGGANFRSIGEGIPDGHAVTTMTEDPKNPNVLYMGTEFGLFVSPDRGGKWTRIKANLPTVPIHEIVFHPRDNDMIVATHGRSIWILDDATPVQQAAEAMKADAHLFDIRAARQFNQANDRGFVTDKPFFGKNPDYGALLTYYLAKESTNVALRIRDAAGSQVREISGNDLRDARRAGFNRVNWDLRHQPLPAPAGQQPGGGGGGFGGGGAERAQRAAGRIPRHAGGGRQGCGHQAGARVGRHRHAHD